MTDQEIAQLERQLAHFEALAAQWQADAEGYRIDAGVWRDRAEARAAERNEYKTRACQAESRLDEIEQALQCHRETKESLAAAPEATAPGSASQAQRRRAKERAESEAAALRVEVERLRRMVTVSYTEVLGANDLREQLAAANALLEYMATEAPDTAIGEATMRLIRAHLSGQALARTDHERAVLEAVERSYDEGLSLSIDVTAAEFARREAAK